MTRDEANLSWEYLKQILHYDPETGIWLNLTKRGRTSAGSVAGYRTGDGYLTLGIDRGHYRSGRLAWFYMTGVWPPVYVDHKDMDRTNDRWDNLRLATHSQNMANRRVNPKNSLGVKGVTLRINCRERPYAAKITVGGKIRDIGFYSTVEEAGAAYLRAASEAFGEFARA